MKLIYLQVVSYICPVNNYSEGDNKNEVRQLFGNVWEWCQEAIYPYDGFKIDPVYKEFSYPFFGFKKILRGGSWATPDILINSRYRNAQMPDCRIQFTGIRVVKSIQQNYYSSPPILVKYVDSGAYLGHKEAIFFVVIS